MIHEFLALIPDWVWWLLLAQVWMCGVSAAIVCTANTLDIPSTPNADEGCYVIFVFALTVLFWPAVLTAIAVWTAFNQLPSEGKKRGKP